ncbi:MAG: ribonuclease M5 [Helcococcus sp.]|nr:ribonuclease M5 [Helcococcus sp.]
MKKIREVIVVEGKSDIVAVKRAFEGNIDVIATHGLGLKPELLEELVEINDRKGIIVLTDPDYAGKRISNIIREYVPNAKFASISKSKATKNLNIGVENASDEAIIEAIERARPSLEENSHEFNLNDIIDNGLMGLPNSKDKRIAFCNELKITYCNSKQLLMRINMYGITREEFNEALKNIEV